MLMSTITIWRSTVELRFINGALTNRKIFPPNAPPQPPPPHRVFSASAETASGPRSGWRLVLGHRPRALPASTLHVVSVVSASFVTVRAAVRDRPFAVSEHILRQRRASADAKHPARLACQD